MTPAMTAGLPRSTMAMSAPVAVIDACHEREAKRAKQVTVSTWVITVPSLYSQARRAYILVG